MKSTNYMALFLALVVVISAIPSLYAGLIPYGIDALYSRGSPIKLPLKGKDLKRDWCVGRSMAKKVHHPGCNSTEVKSKLCFGQCMTYYIPVSKFSSCSQCTPSKIETVEVKLSCRNGLAKRKRVQVVKRCSCKTCLYAKKYLEKMRRNLST
eukprot:gene4949-21293_t